jgi:hypothetical protein
MSGSFEDGSDRSRFKKKKKKMGICMLADKLLVAQIGICSIE